jgi:hypothetical protein
MFGIAAVAVMILALVGIGWGILKKRSKAADGSANSGQLIRLHFALPCALQSGDADAFYSALRRSDRRGAEQMLAAKQVVMLRPDTEFSLMPIKDTAVVLVNGNDRAGSVCYVPLNIVSTLEKRAYR